MKKIPSFSLLFRLLAPAGAALFLAVLLFSQLSNASLQVNAAPIDPPEGYAKFNASAKVVTPTLANTGGATLTYVVEVRNTGAYTSDMVSMVDKLPAFVTYNDDAQASSVEQPVFDPISQTLSWDGIVGFDTTVLITFSVGVSPVFSGTLENAAVISHPATSETISVTAEAVITDDPILTIAKSSTPAIPGPNKELTYWLEVTNEGQPAVGLPVVVTDRIPLDTSINTVGADGTFADGTVTFNRTVDLETGETSVFTFSVDIHDVPSGTVITNDAYSVAFLADKVGVGEPITTTVLDPILLIAKHIYPDPPGSNGTMVYTITVVNLGSVATDLEITDVVPSNVTYIPGSGGSYNAGIVSWNVPRLDTDELVQVSYAVEIGDIAQVPIINDTYAVCSAEGICSAGDVLTSTVFGPTFEVTGWVDPLAKKPGGGNVVVTPTLVVENLGPGSALDATAILTFRRITVSQIDVLITDPPGRGNFYDGPSCGDKCNQYYWIGDIAAYETITFTTIEGQSSVGGAEGTGYTATLVITDQLGTYVTEPITGSAVGKVTHFSNLIPTKSGPTVIGTGEILTYVIDVFNSGQTTDLPPNPVLTETIPLSTTFVSASGDPGGDPIYDPVITTLGEETTISWMLPSMGPGAHVLRTFSVLVPDDMVTGTQIINDRYGTLWVEGGISETTQTGVPFTTTVKEVGLIDSYKEVSPQIVLPGPGNVLTYTLHVVNSSANDLFGVEVYDWLPWQSSTYQRDAVATAGTLEDDIVSVLWTGDVAAFSEETITLTVLVDEDFSGVITNTAVITHPTLRAPVEIDAVAYVTDQPVLTIEKTATPDPAHVGDMLLYTIKVTNMGQRATQVVITDTVPDKTVYIEGSVSAGGSESNGEVRWELLLLQPGESATVTFRVEVGKAQEIVNSSYRVSCFEGAYAVGLPVVTIVADGGSFLYLPIVMR